MFTRSLLAFFFPFFFLSLFFPEELPTGSFSLPLQLRSRRSFSSLEALSGRELASSSSLRCVVSILEAYDRRQTAKGRAKKSSGDASSAPPLPLSTRSTSRL